jgi:septal ring factor EnvC (AmiA/AmiB activator)
MTERHLETMERRWREAQSHLETLQSQYASVMQTNERVNSEFCRVTNENDAFQDRITVLEVENLRIKDLENQINEKRELWLETHLDTLRVEYAVLKEENKDLETFIDKAFEAHPNLDMDIEYG